MSIGLIAFRISQKKVVKLKVWKVIFVLYVGIFSFTINWPMFDAVVRIPVLPLGVWLLYFVLKQKEGRWEKYRSFAWLGFWANGVFLATTLLAVPLQHVIYPEGEASTYLANVENATLIPIHPTATEQMLNKAALENHLPNMKVEMVYSQDWYEETYMEMETNVRNERFPYQLTGVSPKWGSGKSPIIYVEINGKGLLVKKEDKEFYFRSTDSFLEGGK
jgi:hypothetical protein